MKQEKNIINQFSSSASRIVNHEIYTMCSIHNTLRCQHNYNSDVYQRYSISSKLSLPSISLYWTIKISENVIKLYIHQS